MSSKSERPLAASPEGIRAHVETALEMGAIIAVEQSIDLNAFLLMAARFHAQARYKKIADLSVVVSEIDDN